MRHYRFRQVFFAKSSDKSPPTGILYNEWAYLPFVDILGNLCGFATIILGVFQMTLFKVISFEHKSTFIRASLQDVTLTWRQLAALMRKPGEQQLSPNLNDSELNGTYNSIDEGRFVL